MVASKGMPSGKPYSMKGFWALIATQFQGAFNDNLFQFLIQFTILGVLIGPGKTADESTATMVTAVSTIIFSLPFLVFPGVAGALSDRYSKQFIAVCVKVWEIFIVCFGFFAFYLESPAFLWVMLFFMATHSAFFSPAKYGILPEILEESQLSWGNGVLQMWTIIAIIAGTGAAGPLHSALGGKTYLATFVLLFLSCAGLVMAQYISKPPA
ncbi:MAG TPA: acyl-[ACP]--phospholipid O-acyltransferase, partial [Candidatus Hydrogenedentes bacterium]|nr:acyl-[ACP]--phospholipid O-acyltransferase [Candidatus Hydrogenedentota bacterium]